MSSTPAAKCTCSVLSSNPGPSASQVGAKEGQANKEMQAALLKVMQEQQAMMQAFAQQLQLQQQQSLQAQTQVLQSFFAHLAQQQTQQHLQPPQVPIAQMLPPLQKQRILTQEEQLALWQAQQVQQQQQQQLAQAQQLLQQQQLAQEQQHVQLLQQEPQALEQPPAGPIPQHAFTNPVMAMRAPFINTPNGPTYVTPPTPTATVHYVRAPVTRPSGPNNLYPPSDNDNEPMQ